MPLERRVLDERGHRDLVQGRRGHAGDQQHVLNVVDQVRGRDHPGQAQRRGQRLARRPHERHQVRGQALQRSHRFAPEPVLHVVVVLHDQRRALARPRDQGAAALGRHHHPGRVVMRRGHHHRVDIGRGQLANVHAVGVHPHRDRLQPGVLDGVPLPAPAGILDRHPPPAVLAQRVPEHGQRLGGRAAHHHVLGLDHHAAHPGQVSGQRVPELGHAAVVGVAEPGVGQLPQGAQQRRLPGGAREGVEVGLPGPQVVPEPVRRGDLARGGRNARARQRRHPGPRSAPGRQVALGGQLRVAVDHHAPRHAQLLGQVPAGRQRRPRYQPAGADRHPQRVLELAAKGAPGPEVDLQIHVPTLPEDRRLALLTWRPLDLIGIPPAG